MENRLQGIEDIMKVIRDQKQILKDTENSMQEGYHEYLKKNKLTGNEPLPTDKNKRKKELEKMGSAMTKIPIKEFREFMKNPEKIKQIKQEQDELFKQEIDKALEKQNKIFKQEIDKISEKYKLKKQN